MPTLAKPCHRQINPAMAKAVWESFEVPAARKVSQAFRAAGYAIKPETIRVWRRNGWKWKGEWKGPTSAHEQAARSLDIGFPALTGDPRSRIKELTPPRTAEEVIQTGQERMAQLAKLTEAEQARAASLASMRAGIVVCEEIARQSEYLVKNNPAGLAQLLTGVAQAFGQTVESEAKLTLPQRDENGGLVGEVLPPHARVLNGNGHANGHARDPLAESLAAWGMPTPVP